MVGVAVSIAELNNSLGSICLGTQVMLRRAMRLKAFLDGRSAQDLVDQNLCASLDDATLAKSAATSLEVVNAAYEANKTFIDRCAGLGDV